MKSFIMILFGISMLTNNLLAQEKLYLPKAPGVYVVGEQDEKEILESLPPELKKELLKIKEIDPEQYNALLYETSFNNYDVYAGFVEKERYETQKKVQELELFTQSLGIRYEHANDNEKPKIINDLKSHLNKLFDMKEKSRAVEVEMLEKELTQLKESLKVRKKNKSEIINRRMNELIGKGDYLDW